MKKKKKLPELTNNKVFLAPKKSELFEGIIPLSESDKEINEKNTTLENKIDSMKRDLAEYQAAIKEEAQKDWE